MSKKRLRAAVFIMCISMLFSLLGCGKKNPFMVDGPGMERPIWSAFTIARCDERYEPIYSYTVKYDTDSDKVYLYEGQEENGIQFRQETVTELLNMNLLSLADEEPVTGNFLSLSVYDSVGKAFPKRISKALENEILELLDPYLDELKKGNKEDPVMPDGSGTIQEMWSAVILSQTSDVYEQNFAYEVKYDNTSGDMTLSIDEYDYELGYPVEKSVTLDNQTASAILAYDWMNFPDAPREDNEGILDGTFFSVSVRGQTGLYVKKDVSYETIQNVLKLLDPYIKELKNE